MVAQWPLFEVPCEVPAGSWVSVRGDEPARVSILGAAPISCRDGRCGGAAAALLTSSVIPCLRGCGSVPCSLLHSSLAGSLQRSGVRRRLVLEEGCGHADVVCLRLSGWCQVRNRPRGGQFRCWSIRCPGAEPGITLGLFVVPGPVRECFIANKTFKWG